MDITLKYHLRESQHKDPHVLSIAGGDGDALHRVDKETQRLTSKIQEMDPIVWFLLRHNDLHQHGQ